MSVTSDILNAIAEVHDAGAVRLERYAYNIQDQHSAEAHRAMATEARSQAKLKENP
jgi:hypothetical protein